MEPLSAREQRKLQDEIARQEKQEKVAGQQKQIREKHVQQQQKVFAELIRLSAALRIRQRVLTALYDLQRQQDMLQHQQTNGHWLSQLETAPTFYPTAGEFADPIAYIRSIQTEGSKNGASSSSPASTLRSCCMVRRVCRYLQNRPSSYSDGTQWPGETLIACLSWQIVLSFTDLYNVVSGRCSKSPMATSSVFLPESRWYSN